jgi:hypothetical protein
VSAGRNTFTVQVNTGSFEAIMDQLADDAEAAVRPAAQAGAQVLYDEARRLAGANRRTGNLQAGVYQVFSKSSSGRDHAVYHISWNAKKAPHGHLVEFGHWQRYATYRDARGRILTMVRPEKRGMPKPPRRASQAVKDAYWMPLPGGPKRVPARSFIRRALENKGAQASAAMEQALLAAVFKQGARR